MSKKIRKKAAPTTVEEPGSPKESFFSRNRGKIALALGIAIGANSGSILRVVSHTANWAYTEAEDKFGKIMRLSTLERDKESEADPVKESINAMPSPCDLREGTFLADSAVLERKCEDETSHPPVCSCSMSYKLKELRYTTEDARIHASQLIKLYDSSMCNLEDGSEENGDPTCDIKKDDDSKFERDKYRTLENIPEPYRSTLEAFDPESYSSLKKTTLIQDENDQLIGIEYGNLGTSEGPLSLVCGQLVASENGQFHVVEMSDKLDEIDLEHAIWAGDRVALRKYMLNTTVLAHEVFGHVGNMSGPGSLCEMMDPVQSAKDELYAHYVSAKMLAFVVQRHTVLHDIIKEDEAEYELQSKLRKLSICELGLEEKELQNKELGLILSVELLKSYLLAKQSGNWEEFKYLIIDRTKIGTWESVAYMLAYYSQNGRTEDFQKLNEAFGVLMNSESPVKLLGKK